LANLEDKRTVRMNDIDDGVCEKLDLVIDDDKATVIIFLVIVEGDAALWQICIQMKSTFKIRHDKSSFLSF